MPRSASVAMTNFLQEESTTLAMLFKITSNQTTPPTVLGFTTFDQNLVVDGVTYNAAGAYIPSSLDTSSSLSVDNMELSGILISDLLTESDLIGGFWDGAEIEISMVNWADLSMGRVKLQKGWLGEVRVRSSGGYFFDLRGIQELMGKPFGEFPGTNFPPLNYSQQCPFSLGDSRCRQDLTLFTHTGTVTSVTNENVFVDTGMAQVDGYFNDGFVTWTSGSNEGRSTPVKTWVASGTTFTFWLPTPYPIQVGDTYSAVAGCDKELTTCRDKFGNVINFGGFPTIPGRNETLSYGPPGPNA